MLNRAESPTPQVEQLGPQKRTEYRRRTAQWEPIYADYAEKIGGGPMLARDEHGRIIEDLTVQEPPKRSELHHDKLAPPIGWLCPCGGVVHVAVGCICCPMCGRVPRDSVPGKLNGSQRCTTGRQGRDWKKIGKGGRC